MFPCFISLVLLDENKTLGEIAFLFDSNFFKPCASEQNSFPSIDNDF